MSHTTAFRRSLFLIVLLTLWGCGRTRSDRQDVVARTVEVPRFEIAVKLSSKADKQLRSLNESIKVIAYFDGDPLPGQGRYNPPMRDVYLGSHEQLVDEKNVAKFEHVTVPLSDWDRLANKNYFVTINTVSARKVETNNLLDCDDPMSAKIEDFRDKTVEIPCWLIDEAKARAK